MDNTIKQLLIETGADAIEDIIYDEAKKKWVMTAKPIVRPKKTIHYPPQEYNSFSELYNYLIE